MQNLLQKDLARSRVIRHPSGVEVKTPLLIPGISSKGFRRRGNRSEARSYLKVAEPLLEESLLISAYDIYYKYVPAITRKEYGIRLLFIDSGGYETAEDHDFSAVLKHDCTVKEWDVLKLKEVFMKCPKTSPAVLVSYDHGAHRVSLRRQIENAHKLFCHFPDHLHEFLIKPERTWKGYLKCDCVCQKVGDLKDFHIVGVTEKELGKSTLERMKNIATIRSAMDAKGIDAPLHVFGSLDPITTCLYFLAGAEIFDGLTWLRYGYCEGKAVYYQNYVLIDDSISIAETDEKVIAYMVLRNLSYLGNLRDRMTAYLLDGEFDKFETPICEKIQSAHDMLRTQLGDRV